MARSWNVFSTGHKTLRKMTMLRKIPRSYNSYVSIDEKNRNASPLVKKLDVERIITNNTEITRDHLTPELRLRLLTPNCPLYNAPITRKIYKKPISSKNDEEEYDEKARRIFHEPFWSIYWPGGQALTRFILDHAGELLNEPRRDTNFLDIGSGCGASAIAAKMIGATRVIANDIDKVACVAARLNASLNNVTIEVTSKNLLENRAWGQYDGSTVDVISVGDLLYDEETAASLIPWLVKASRENGSRIYLGDPGRHALTDALKSRMELRKVYELPENVKRENYGYDNASVWQLKIESY